MAKQALLSVLKNTIGKYVSNLDAESLHVGIWKGQIELHDLTLDLDACQQALDTAVPHPIPLQVLGGSFQSLQIDIPWRHLSSKSVILKAHGLHLQVSPHSNNNKNQKSGHSTTSTTTTGHEDQKEEEQQATQQRVQEERETALLLANTARLQTQELLALTSEFDDNSNHTQSKEKNGGGGGLVARLVKRIIENLQVDIQDVSVTIVLENEDATTTPTTTAGSSFFGVELQQLSFVTTDMAGQRTYVDRSSASTQQKEAPHSDLLNQFLYKKLTLGGFGIFVDGGATVDPQLKKDAIEEQQQQHTYILQPLDLEAKLREADASITNEYPKWWLQSKLPAVHMTLSQTQYQQSIQLSQRLQETVITPYMGSSTPLFPELRPVRRPIRKGDNAHEWWQYAIQAVRRLTGKQSWQLFYHAFQTRKLYINLYKRQQFAPGGGGGSSGGGGNNSKTICPWLEPLTIVEYAELDRIESDRTISIEGIMLWRTLAEKQIEKEHEKYVADHPNDKTTASNKKGGFLSGWFGSSSSYQKGTGGAATTMTSSTTPIELSIDELKALEDVGLDQLGLAQDLTNTAKLYHVEFQLGELSLYLLEEQSQQQQCPLLGFDMGTVSTSLEATVGGSFDFEYRLRNLEIIDYGAQREGSLFSSILKSIPSSSVQQPDQDSLLVAADDEVSGRTKTIIGDETNSNSSSSRGSRMDAFHIRMTKNSRGDSKLSVKLIPFEAVVAPHLLSEIMEFIKSPTSPTKSGVEEEIDDGGGGEDEQKSENTPTLMDRANEEVRELSSEYADSFSNALVDAWHEKTKERTSLTIDLDLQAPILILPENCKDLNASVLVLDLGGFRFQYGSGVDSSPVVSAWLADNVRDPESYNLRVLNDDNHGRNQEGLVVDYGVLELDNMTFMVGEADAWRSASLMKQNGTYKASQEAIIEPISVRIDFAVESAISSSIPRVCLFADIPTSNFKFLPKHLSDTLRVYSAWMRSIASIESFSSSHMTDISGSQESGSHANDVLPPEVQAPENDDHKVGNIQVEEAHQAIETSLSSESVLFTMIYAQVKVNKYSFAVYDSGDFLQSKKSKKEKSMPAPLSNVVEGLVFEGGVELTVDMTTNKARSASGIETEIQGQNFQIFSGFGEDLRRPLQIMEPVTGRVNLALQKRSEETRTKIEACLVNEVAITFSMRNLALINAISQDVSFSLLEGLQKTEESKQGVSKSLKGLDDSQVHRIEAIELALQGDSDNNTNIVLLQEPIGSPRPAPERGSLSSSVIVVNATVSKSTVTIINDLQGLDEALFRITVQDFTTETKVASIPDLKSTCELQTIYDSKVKWKFLADYFDPSVNRWKYLLKEPWELAFRSERSQDLNSMVKRYSTRADIHFMPLHLTFSEHFLIGLGSLNRMLTMSAENEKRRVEMRDSSTHGNSHQEHLSMESTRHLVAALPYALENCSGLDVEYSISESRGTRACLNGCKEFFRFDRPKSKGAGSWRQYGEDAVSFASVRIFVKDNTIDVENLDDQLGRPKRCHILNDNTVVVTTVVREGKSTVLRLASNFSMRNWTPVPIHVSIRHKSTIYSVGDCPASSSLVKSNVPRLVPIDVKHGTVTKSSCRLGLRFEKMTELGRDWAENKKAKLTLLFSPELDGSRELLGELELEMDHNTIANAKNRTIRLHKEVTCCSAGHGKEDFVFQARVKLQLIGDIKLVASVAIEPRAQFVNTLPVDITVLTKTRQALSGSTFGVAERKDCVHHLPRGSKMEIYSPGATIALKVRCSEVPAGGTPTGMMRQWVEIPVVTEMSTPRLCLFPFDGDQPASDSEVPGSEFFIAEANSRLPNFFLEQINDKIDDQDVVKDVQKSGPKTYLFVVGNYGVDHTNSVLFEQIDSRPRRSSKGKSFPFSAFLEEESKRNISLLPTAEVPIRLREPGSTGDRRTAIFRVEEVSMSEGGAQATPLLWDDGSQSGYFTYRRLVSSFQSELHVIPEFLVFNGDDKRTVTIKQLGADDIRIAPLQTRPVFSSNREKGLRLAFRYDDVNGSTNFLNLEELGLHIEIVRTPEGVSLGSVAVQTSIGSTDSRLVIKLGKVGSIEREKPKNPVDMLPPTFVSDSLRLRVRLDMMVVTLNQASVVDADADGQGTLEEANKGNTQRSSALQRTYRDTMEETAICTIMMANCVYDVQRLFKDAEKGSTEAPERCQLSFIIQDLKVFDEMPDSPFPIVFQYSGENRFLDICVRTKGPLYANTVKIDLLDIILAHSGGDEKNRSEKITIQTYEDFIWKLLDTADLISKASLEGAEPTDQGEIEKALAAYVASWHVVPDMQYLPPQVSTIYNIAKARVSPFNINLSFTRTPQAERYEKFINNQGAHLMRYFTQQLKFTIKSCNLRFSPYEQHSLQGPMDRLIEILTAVYVSRMKLKAVSILAASSFSDWKSLAARDGGEDEFVDGDVLRVTGTIAGNSVAYAFNKVGRGLGKGVSVGFNTIGDGIENGAALVGARGVGSNVNSVISAVGGGIAGTFQGVGEGTGNLAKGAGKGLGHFFGGISGGGKAVIKGLGKGVAMGDHKAVASGFKEGARHMGSGLRQSAKAAGSGVGGGVGSVVAGPTKGVRKSIAKSSVRSSKASSKADDLAALREEFKDQDYS